MKINGKLSNSLLIVIGCTFFFLSCSNETENGINQETVVNIMTELMTIEHLAEPDSIKALKISKIMQTYNIGIDSLKNIISKFEKQPAYWQSVYNNIKNQLKETPERIPSQK